MEINPQVCLIEAKPKGQQNGLVSLCELNKNRKKERKKSGAQI
jgi:hypothetical protein